MTPRDTDSEFALWLGRLFAVVIFAGIAGGVYALTLLMRGW